MRYANPAARNLLGGHARISGLSVPGSIWEMSGPATNCARRLRVMINAGGKPDLIRTVRLAGYALDTADA